MLPVTVQFIVAMPAYALNQRMPHKAEYLREENRVLNAALQAATGKSRIDLSDEQRRRLATQGKILAEAGVEPAPERNKKRTWKQFIRSHWETLYACDFFAVETLGVFGTVRYMVYVVIELKSRAVRMAGIRIAPDVAWMMPVARNLLDPVDAFLRNGTDLIHDRDPLYAEAWTKLLESEGVKSVRIPASSPNCNPYAERFVRTARSECLAPFRIFGERHLRHLLGESCVHYHGERFHQGLDGQLIRPPTPASTDNGTAGAIHCRSRLGGLLNYYHREAA